MTERRKVPPARATPERLSLHTGSALRGVVRGKEHPCAEQGLANAAISGPDILAPMLADPFLIDRPIAKMCDTAQRGRPSETVHELIAALRDKDDLPRP